MVGRASIPNLPQLDGEAVYQARGKPPALLIQTPRRLPYNSGQRVLYVLIEKRIHSSVYCTVQPVSRTRLLFPSSPLCQPAR
jgi:hypothetical protein